MASSTRDQLIKIGKEEFLSKGYKDASLREIAKKAGFTLGAFYGYYRNKEALFEDIVKGPADELHEYFLSTQNEFAMLPSEDQAADMDQVTEDSLLQMLNIMYRDIDIFKLIIFKSAGTEYEHYINKLIDIEIFHTYRYIKLLKDMGHIIDVDEDLVHILSSSMFSGIMEVVDHDMAKEQAIKYIMQLRIFYSAGWHRLFGI